MILFGPSQVSSNPMERLFGRKRRPSLCLSGFDSIRRTSTAFQDSPKPNGSSRSVFFNPDAVGLGIIARESGREPSLNPTKRILFLPMLFRTSNKRTPAVDPLSESYTDVIFCPCRNNNAAGGSSVSGTRSPREARREEGTGPCSDHFLSRCLLCKKELHKSDIYMYRYNWNIHLSHKPFFLHELA